VAGISKIELRPYLHPKLSNLRRASDLTLLLLALSQAHSRATAVLVDELDPRGFKSSANG
jgi:hypothetical protein